MPPAVEVRRAAETFLHPVSASPRHQLPGAGKAASLLHVPPPPKETGRGRRSSASSTASGNTLRRRGARDHGALALQILALAALVAIPLFIQPAIAAHAPGTPDFARLHGISMALNLFSLIAVPVASLLVIWRRKE